MKRIALSVAVMCCAITTLFAKDIVKTGLNLGPLPAVAYDADKGFQMGAILQLFDYGDGTNYPNYNSKTYFEYSYFTKGSHLIQLRHDNKTLIPGVRWSSALRINLDRAHDFYGFNGYQTLFDYEKVNAGKDKSSSDPIYTPFYRMQDNRVTFKSDFIGRITDHLNWEAGIFVNYFDFDSIDYDNVNKGKAEEKRFPEAETTLYDIYRNCGLLNSLEADGGYASGLRAGLVYDSRNKEGAPTHGIWAESHITAALPGISEEDYYRYNFVWRHYLPLVSNDVLTFAYRLIYEGTFGSYAPYYALPFMSVMGEKPDEEGMGGFHNTRGMMRARVVGLDMAAYTAELRWRFCKFNIGKQNIALGLNFFSDGSMVTRGRDLSLENAIKNSGNLVDAASKALWSLQYARVIDTDRKETPHITFGTGFRFIMNENFIVAADFGKPLSSMVSKSNPIYGQDGKSAFYVNLGYLF